MTCPTANKSSLNPANQAGFFNALMSPSDHYVNPYDFSTTPGKGHVVVQVRREEFTPTERPAEE